MTVEMMTTEEVADYLRLKPRKVYELVRTREIPCARVTGKLLFPRQAIELWVAQRTEFAGGEIRRAPPPVAAGSHDPLLEWALRESGCGLALLTGGSLDGLRRLAEYQAVLAGIHIVDPGGDDNIAALRQYAELAGVVLIEWARREQGLILARGNPLGIRGLGDLVAVKARVARRQEAAGAHLLLLHLLDHAGIATEQVKLVDPPALTETDLAAAVLDGKADCGLAVRAVARRFGLDFIPLHVERFDLAMRRFDYFEPPVQALIGFARTAAFARRADELGGYDITALGRVRYNG